MSEQFDPYYQWLGIRPHEQPPDQYQLLGLRRFEDNADAIHNAADRQTAYLRTMQSGEHAVLSQKLLDEVAAAKGCLLTPARKTAYDASLRTTTEKGAKARREFWSSPVASNYGDSLATEGCPHTTLLPLQKKQRGQREWPSRQVAIIGGASGVALVAAVVLLFGQGGSTETTPAANSPAAEADTARTIPRPTTAHSPPESRAAAKPQPQAKHDAPVPTSAQHTPAPVAKSNAARAPTPGKRAPKAVAAKVASAKKPPTKSPLPRAGAAKTTSKPERPREKLPVPSLAVQDEIAKQMDDLYKGAKTSAEKVKLARQLMSVAESSQKADERFVIRRKAAELASDAGQTAVMRQAIEAIAAEFKINALMVEAKMLERQKAIDGADEFLRRAVVEDRYDAALIVVNHWRQKAPARDRKEVHRRQKEIERLQDQWLEASVAVRSLEGASDDPSGNLKVGRWLWFQKGDVREGLSHLAKGSDEGLKRLAREELAEQLAESDAHLKLADAWWELAQSRKGEEKDRLMLHAAEWYEDVDPTIPGGLTKVRIEKRLEQTAPLKRSLAKSLIPLPFGTCVKAGRDFPIGRWTDLLASADVKRDGVGGHWERNGIAIVTKPARNSTLLLPVAVEGDYDLDVQFARSTGQDTIAIVFPVGANPCLLTLSEFGGRTSRLAIKVGLSPPQQDNRIRIEPSVLTNGQKYAVLVAVRLRSEDASIQVSLDGRPHLNWSGKQNAVSVEGWPARQMAIGAHDAVAFHRVRLRPVSGKASLTVAHGK